MTALEEKISDDRDQDDFSSALESIVLDALQQSFVLVIEKMCAVTADAT